MMIIVRRVTYYESDMFFLKLPFVVKVSLHPYIILRIFMNITFNSLRHINKYLQFLIMPSFSQRKNKRSLNLCSIFICKKVWHQGQCHKPFYGRRLRIFVKSQSVYPWQAFPALSNVCGSCLTIKHYPILEKLARDKHQLIAKIRNLRPQKV